MTFAAITDVLGGMPVFHRAIASDADLRALTREGMPAAAVPALAAGLSLDRKSLARVVGISDRTLSRRLASASRLSAEESDRVLRVARIVALASDTLGEVAKAARWLKKPNRALEDQVPLELLDTDSGARAVEDVLLRIEYGIYS